MVTSEKHRVVYSSFFTHFWFIFTFHFHLLFEKWNCESMQKCQWKWRFCKMVVPPHFLCSFSHCFLKRFLSSTASTVGHMYYHATLLPMTQKPGQENATTSPQPNMKQIWKSSSKVLEAVANTTDNKDTAKQTSKAWQISWTSARTEHLLNWLDENPIDWQKFFSDSSKDAKEEGRRKYVAKIPNLSSTRWSLHLSSLPMLMQRFTWTFIQPLGII